MKGVVRVVFKRHGIPSANADAKALAAQIARDTKTVKALIHTAVAAGNVSVGASGRVASSSTPCFRRRRRWRSAQR
jgi:hypothetical protein